MTPLKLLRKTGAELAQVIETLIICQTGTHWCDDFGMSPHRGILVAEDIPVKAYVNDDRWTSEWWWDCCVGCIDQFDVLLDFLWNRENWTGSKESLPPDEMRFAITKEELGKCGYAPELLPHIFRDRLHYTGKLEDYPDCNRGMHFWLTLFCQPMQVQLRAAAGLCILAREAAINGYDVEDDVQGNLLDLGSGISLMFRRYRLQVWPGPKRRRSERECWQLWLGD